MESMLIKKDSFTDDFKFSHIKRAFSKNYSEGKQDKASALKQAAGAKKQKEATADREAKKMLWSFLGHQWPLLLLGTPFMFAGSLIEFLVPSYIGKIVNMFKEKNFDKEGGVYDLLYEWLIFLAITIVCAFFRELIFGITSQRLGRSIR